MIGQSQLMSAITVAAPGGPEMLRNEMIAIPGIGANEVLVRVRAAGVNRGDVVQRQGLYPPPPGVTSVPGLEIAGEIVAVGSEVVDWRSGDTVCALLAGGGYAQYAAVPTGQCLRIPGGFSFTEAAALPEALFTCWATLIEQGQLTRNEAILVHGGSSGIGMAAIQLAKAFGARVIVTAGSKAKCEACMSAGADAAINYRTDDFVDEVLRLTDGRGVDVVLDMVAGDYVARNIRVMAALGRHVTIGVMSGDANATIPMNLLLRNRLVLTASTLRGRSIEEKSAIRDNLLTHVWPLLEDGLLRPHVHSVFPLKKAAQAQALLEAGSHIGKIVLEA